MAEARTESTVNATKDSLGARLRAARDKRRLSLHQAAQDMHVSDDFIAALERDDYTVLGAPIFVHGHLRNYAQLLGLPADQVLADYEHASSKLAPPPLMTLKPGGNAVARRVSMQVFSAIVIVVLVALAVVWWQHRVPPQSETAVVRASPAAQTQARVAEPLPSAGTTSAPLAQPNVVKREAASTQTLMVANRHPVTRTAEVPAGPRPRAQASVAAPISAVTARLPAAAANVPAGPVMHVRFVVTQASWIEVYDATGKRLFYNTAPAGDNLNLSGIGPLQVFLGYSPGVSIELNGTPFNQAAFMQPNNTARFRLEAATSNGGQAG